MSGLALSASAGSASPLPSAGGALLRLASSTGRVAWRKRKPAAASTFVAAVAGTVMSTLWASSTLTANARGRHPLPLIVRDAAIEGGRGRLRLQGPQFDVPGRWGLAVEDGYAVVEDPGPDGDRPVRVVHGRIEPGARARLDAHLYDAGRLPPELGHEEVTVDTPAGPCPAWRFRSDAPADTGTWAIFVHGRGASRTQGLRLVPTLREAGLTTLLASYRGDEGGPAAPLSGLGCHEWRDLEAAVGHAVHAGARRVVLVGYSMGAALITAFLRRSPLAPTVVGVVLDSPVLDWGAVLRHVARARRLPSFLVPATMTVSAIRARIDWHLLNAFDGEQVHRPPCLLFHGTADDLVPMTLSDALAEAWPDHVTYHRFEDAPHVAAYNTDPVRYEEALRTFLADLADLADLDGVTEARERPLRA